MAVLGFRKPNLKLKSIDLPHKDVRDYPVADTDLLTTMGDAQGPLFDGEFVYLNTDGELARAVSGVNDFDGDPLLVISGAGRIDTKTTGMASVYWGAPGLEFETKVWKQDDSFAVGSNLTISAVTIDAVSKAGLRLSVSGEAVYAVCVEAASAAGEYARVKSVAKHYMP